MSNLLEIMSQTRTVDVPVWLIIIISVLSFKGLFK